MVFDSMRNSVACVSATQMSFRFEAASSFSEHGTPQPHSGVKDFLPSEILIGLLQAEELSDTFRQRELGRSVELVSESNPHAHLPALPGIEPPRGLCSRLSACNRA